MLESLDRGRVLLRAKGTMLRSGLTFFPLDDGLVAFSETSQSLIGLNATAAFIARALEKGTPASELAQALVSERGVAPEDAEIWAKDAISALASQGLFEGDNPAPPAGNAPAGDNSGDKYSVRQQRIPPFAAVKPVVEAHYRLLGTHALIRYSHRAQMRMVDHVIGHLKTAV
jgi:hypothetical protein